MKLNIEIKKVTKSLCAVFLAWGVMFSPFAKPIFATETDEDERIDELIEEETTTIVETTTVETTTLAETTTAVETTAATILEETLIDDFTVELLADDLQSSSDQNDKYAISIEFGALHFYYDWGTWDTNSHEYKADPSSSDPAVGTTSGKPGWYGFNGQNNQIKITNTSLNDAVQVTIKFTMDRDSVYDQANQVEWVDLKNSEIQMSLYQGTLVNGDTTKPVFAFGEQHTSGAWVEEGYEIVLEKGVTETMFVSFEGEPLYEENSKKYNGNNAEIPHAFGFLLVTVAVVEPVDDQAES